MRTHVVALVFALVANAAANIMIKAGMRARDLSPADPAGLLRAVLTSPLVLAGIVLFALNVVSYAYVLTRVPLSVAYPIMVAGGLLIVLTASSLLLRETIDLPLVAGVVLIVAGVVLVAGRLE